MTGYFFDLDGTLTDSRAGLFRCFRAGLAAIGVEDAADEALQAFLGVSLPRLFRGFDPAVSEAGIEAGIAAFRAEFALSGVAANRLYDGATNMLDAVRQAGAPCWMVTAKPQPFAEQVAAFLGIAASFDGIVGAGLAETDTKGELLARALAATGADAATSIMLGDREDDVIAAVENHVRPVGARWGFGHEAELRAAGCEAFADSPDDFRARFIR
jgi:phosphoglycolate phosphatase